MNIDVIVTCYNEEGFITEAVRSIENQTAYDAVKSIILVDDGSTDRTPEIIKRLAESNSKIRCIFKDNGGISSARNMGLRSSQAEFIALLDGDDVWAPEKLSRQISILRESNCDFVYSGFSTFNEKGTLKSAVVPRKVIGRKDEAVKDLYLYGAPILPSTVLYRRQIGSCAVYFDEALKQAEDTDFWLRYLQKATIGFCDIPLVKRRVHSNSLSFDIEHHYSYQKVLLDKVESEIPWLSPYRRRRLTLILTKLLKRQLMATEFKRARATLVQLVLLYL